MSTDIWNSPEDYDLLSQNIQKRNAQLLSRIHPAISQARRVLEVGCGTGLLTEELVCLGLAERLEALDLSAAMIAKAKSKPSLVPVTFIHSSLLDFITDELYDVVISNATFHWLFPHYDKVLKKCYAMLQNNGRLILTTATRTSDSDAFDSFIGEQLAKVLGDNADIPFMARRLSLGAFRLLALDAGFAVEELFGIERRVCNFANFFITF